MALQKPLGASVMLSAPNHPHAHHVPRPRTTARVRCVTVCACGVRRVSVVRKRVKPYAECESRPSSLEARAETLSCLESVARLALASTFLGMILLLYLRYRIGEAGYKFKV